MNTSLSPNPSVLHAPLPRGVGDSSVVKDEKERTIPFLRQLSDMLQNNDELISFVPGQRFPNQIIHGKIIVHDRNRVQSEVLPIYFNHASFASLRRQLSYFSFVRVGTSRQSGVTYTNDSVVDLPDILRLKRRASSGQAAGAAKQSQQHKRQKKEPPSPPKQQQHQEQQPTTTSADDVASAVLSGTLHAAKTNHNLDNNNSSSNGGGSLFNPVSHTSNCTTQSFSSQSISRSSSSTTSSDNASDNVSNNEAGHSKNSGSSPENNKPKVYKRRGTSIAKNSIPRKDRARYDRLLSINNIVPFIHLPVGLTLGPSTKKEGSTTTGTGSNTHIAQERVVQKENKPKSRDRATSDGAIDALLALGVDRQ